MEGNYEEILRRRRLGMRMGRLESGCEVYGNKIKGGRETIGREIILGRRDQIIKAVGRYRKWYNHAQ